MKTQKEKGNIGEQAAADFLKSKGYTILYHNWFQDHKEIDLVCTDKDELVFVEVKNREQWQKVDIRELIPPNKIRNLIQCADLYIQTKDPQREVRFDVIIVNTDQSPPSVKHIVSAFNALDY
ncbi:YraN family protein [Halosquirtibacter xylanolyticus]|uniref:YraN family protein n=1 Tax=Halosquirtibacter xylanolyticus TaxID=3374599 RepID=UPI0037490DBE|nr:YraN family protein [Prolixibacteraceae bacterium]